MTTMIAVPVTTVWTGPDAPRDEDAAMVAAIPDPVAWNAALAPSPPSALHGRTVTQALYGEPLRVVAERAGWLEVVLPWQPSSSDPAGYPGWVPAAHVADAELSDGPLSVVTVPTVVADGRELSYGTVLPTVGRDTDSVRLSGPDGVMRLPAGAVDPVAAPADVRDAEAILASARQFLGMRYLWGGTGGWGVDCSGFVHLVHRRFGITVPRDAYDQLEAATGVEPADAAPGDLYFFGLTARGITHVGFAVNDARTQLAMLHAPDGDAAQHVEDGPMAPQRRADLAGAGTFLRRRARGLGQRSGVRPEAFPFLPDSECRKRFALPWFLPENDLIFLRGRPSHGATASAWLRPSLAEQAGQAPQPWPRSTRSAIAICSQRFAL